MYVASVTETEVRLTLETAVEAVNGLTDPAFDLRATLGDAGFSGAEDADEAELDQLRSRVGDLAELIRSLPDREQDDAAAAVNAELAALELTPSIVDHDGVGPHLHWTPPTATFDVRVVTDIVMALARELCDNGTIRFGRCAAEGCDRLFYDGTRNRSRRFCSDPRCASRTHTADHRARRRAG
ncbi:MAG: CGNR zinc finger domain-containing protein [Actinomycetota bacterium]|nr:CGNR zinc finger domain-containing protein [Actinomycetota bacterium]